MNMQRDGKRMISIWIFIGFLLIAYGALIMGQGMLELFVPPAKPVVLAELHAGIWWGSPDPDPGCSLRWRKFKMVGVGVSQSGGGGQSAGARRTFDHSNKPLIDRE